MALLIVEKLLITKEVRLIFFHRVYISQVMLGCVTATQSPNHSNIYILLVVCVLRELEGRALLIILTWDPGSSRSHLEWYWFLPQEKDIQGGCCTSNWMLERGGWREHEKGAACHFQSQLLGQNSLHGSTQPRGGARRYTSTRKEEHWKKN